MRRRSAFTLIELMVVITIILILMALSLVGLRAARDAGRRTEIRTEISQITQGASLFQNKFGMSPPLSGGGPGGTFRLCTNYIDTTTGQALVWPEVEALKTMFPNMSLTDNGLRNPYSGTVVYPDAPMNLDGNQALFFWLCGADYTKYQGFATSPSQPFKPLNPNLQNEKRIGPFFQPARLDRFYDSGGVIDGRYRDAKGTPYACLGYSIYYVGTSPKRGYQPGVTNFGVSPFLDAQGKPFNPNTLQVISAGIDKTFGPGGAYTPGQGAYAPNTPGEDDISNFKTGQLGSDN